MLRVDFDGTNIIIPAAAALEVKERREARQAELGGPAKLGRVSGVSELMALLSHA